MTDNTETNDTAQADAPVSTRLSTWHINLYRHPTLQMSTLEEAKARRLTGVATGVTVAIRVDEHDNVVDITKIEGF